MDYFRLHNAHNVFLQKNAAICCFLSDITVYLHSLMKWSTKNTSKSGD